MDKIGKKNFLNEMRIEISKCIPVAESRLAHSDHFLEYSKIDRSDLLFITLRIDPPDEDGFNKKSAKDVLDDFAKLFEINDVKTCLDVNNYTQYIDKRFGFRESCKYKLHLHLLISFFFDGKIN